MGFTALSITLPSDESLFIHYGSFKTTKEYNVSLTKEVVVVQQMVCTRYALQKNFARHGEQTLDYKLSLGDAFHVPAVWW